MTQLSLRKNYFIDPAFQIKFISKFCAVVIFSSLGAGYGMFLILKNFPAAALGNTQAVVGPVFDKVFPELAVILLIAAGCASLIVIFLTMVVSHKISGPIFRMKKEIELLQSGDLTRKFSIRNSDQLQELAKSLDAMTQTLRKKHLVIGGQCRSVSNFLEEKNLGGSKDDREKLLQMVKDLYETLSYFKV